MKKTKFPFEIWWKNAGEEEIQAAFAFSDDYLRFLNDCKTEREVADFTEAQLKEQGFQSLDELLAHRPAGAFCSLKPGDKVYKVVHGKAVLAAVIGASPAQEGFNIIASHIDSPRLDFKQTPLYEDINLALAKTHYYGGIKKYQW
ncbi:MAG: aminopeptidase, partial [Peptococcaceae bacterium]|nr:aminopeptidase [Peptococcaceae bacterium]